MLRGEGAARVILYDPLIKSLKENGIWVAEELRKCACLGKEYKSGTLLAHDLA
jgi:hypothetical protein